MKITINLRSGIGPIPLEVDGEEEAVLTHIKRTIEENGIVDLTDSKGDRVVIPAAMIGYVMIPATISHRVGFGRL